VPGITPDERRGDAADAMMQAFKHQIAS
jgi:hypothetical protein